EMRDEKKRLNHLKQDQTMRFGAPPPATGDSPHVSESDTGNRAVKATVATKNRCHCRRRPPKVVEKFITLATAEFIIALLPFGFVSCGLLVLCLGSRERVGNGYKLWYSGSSKARNGVGFMVAGRLKDDVVRVTRRRDGIMAISVVIDGEAVNVINACAPYVGLSDADKKRFWDALDELVREGDLKACRDCRAFPGETCSSRHRLVIVDVLFEKRRHKSEATGRPRILLKNLKGEAVETFRANVFEKLSALEDVMSARNVDQMWNTFADVIKDVERDSLETKQSRFKELLACRNDIQEDIDLAKERYKAANREAKIVVAQAKDEAYEDLYKKLDSKDGANDIYKIAKARERKRRDTENVRYIKDEGGRTIVREEDIRKIWGEYFSSLFNKSTPIKSRPKRNEERMRRNKSVGPDQIPIDAWRCLGKDPCTDHNKEHKVFPGEQSTKGLNNKIERHEVAYQEVDIRIRDQILQPNESFRYLGLVIHKSRRIDEDVAHHIKVCWMKYRAASGVLCDRRIPLKLKGKIYRVAIRPAMLYGLECWPITKAQANKVRRLQSAPVKRVEAMLVEGSRRMGRPKLRWEDRLKQDMKELLLSDDVTSDRNA
nr:hypothetical protein [Tanacetum cinerariifolium]